METATAPVHILIVDDEPEAVQLLELVLRSGGYRVSQAASGKEALAKLQFPRNTLPEWVRQEFSEDQLFWFATAITAFYDEGI